MQFRIVFFVFILSVFLTLVGCQAPENKVDRLRNKLKTSSSQEEWVEIIDKIAQIEHNRASSTLLNTLGDINYRDVHNQVILALGKVRPIHIQTVPKLLEKLSDRTPLSTSYFISIILLQLAIDIFDKLDVILRVNTCWL